MKLMITGAGGFLGSRLAAHFRPAYEIWCPSHRELDLTDAEAVRCALKKERPDVILHCAAVSDVAQAERDPEYSHQVNVEASVSLARFAADGTKLVLCSSDQVYFAEQCESIHPHRETETLSPKPLYGRQKLEMEQRCLALRPDAAALRLSWMYGELTAAEEARGKRNLALTLRRVLRSGQPATFSAADHRGVTDAAEVIRNMEQAWRLPGGVYNFGSPNPVDMAGTAADVVGNGLVLAQYGGSLRNLTMDQSKLNEAGIFFTDTREALRNWLSEHP